MIEPKDAPAPGLDREARTRIGKALRTVLPVLGDPPPPEQADLLARLRHVPPPRPKR